MPILHPVNYLIKNIVLRKGISHYRGKQLPIKRFTWKDILELK